MSSCVLGCMSVLRSASSRGLIVTGRAFSLHCLVQMDMNSSCIRQEESARECSLRHCSVSLSMFTTLTLRFCRAEESLNSFDANTIQRYKTVYSYDRPSSDSAAGKKYSGIYAVMLVVVCGCLTWLYTRRHKLDFPDVVMSHEKKTKSQRESQLYSNTVEPRWCRSRKAMLHPLKQEEKLQSVRHGHNVLHL